MREHIYELRCLIDGTWHPFYVGRTNDTNRRHNEHRLAARNADDTSTLVYQFIHNDLMPIGVEWDLATVDAVSEDQHIMDLLRTGVKLMNMKKGDADWMARRIAEADDMNKRGITDYTTYRKTIDQEQAMARAHSKQDLWIGLTPATTVVDTRTQQRRSIIANVRVEANERSTIQVLEDLKRQQKREQRDAAVQAVRAEQIAQWELTNKTGENQ